jgi:hypothetical protein
MNDKNGNKTLLWINETTKQYNIQHQLQDLYTKKNVKNWIMGIITSICIGATFRASHPPCSFSCTKHQNEINLFIIKGDGMCFIIRCFSNVNALKVLNYCY